MVQEADALLVNGGDARFCAAGCEFQTESPPASVKLAHTASGSERRQKMVTARIFETATTRQ